MDENILTYPTECFEFLVRIGEWNEKKIPLPEGDLPPLIAPTKRDAFLRCPKFIAPTNVTAILRKPFWWDYSKEANGRFRGDPVLVYGESWVGQEICHFPHCKQLLEFNEWLKKYGWFIPPHWYPIRKRICEQQSKYRYSAYPPKDPPSMEELLRLEPSGYVVNGKLYKVGEYGTYLSIDTDEGSCSIDVLSFGGDSASYSAMGRLEAAHSVRCVRGWGFSD